MKGLFERSRDSIGQSVANRSVSYGVPKVQTPTTTEYFYEYAYSLTITVSGRSEVLSVSPAISPWRREE